jgi:hypothetical protein
MLFNWNELLGIYEKPHVEYNIFISSLSPGEQFAEMQQTRVMSRNFAVEKVQWYVYLTEFNYLSLKSML